MDCVAETKASSDELRILPSLVLRLWQVSTLLKLSRVEAWLRNKKTVFFGFSQPVQR